jgi:hypothetical protein
MTDNIPEFSPGCFGSALTFKETDMICMACVFHARCGPVHTLNLARMRDVLGVKEEPKPVVIITPEIVDPIRLTLSKKTQALLAKLDAGGYDIINKLAAKINPFSNTMPHLAIACHLLLKLGRPLEREFLTTALMAKMKWTRATAEEQARVVTYALLHVGAVHSNDGSLTLKG